MIIDEHSVTKRLDRFCSFVPGPICLAVSGGGDSVAMMLHVSEWANSNNREVIVLTVDHGLRKEAERETAWVVDRAKGLGLPSRVLKVNSPNPSQNKSRLYRHRLLANAMRERGSTILMLGHTLDDQAETIAMRLRMKAFRRGLAGMTWVSPSPVWPEGRGLFLVRPILKCKRDDLRKSLTAAGESWIDDPSNDNTAYERIVWRRKIQKSPEKFADLIQTRFRGNLIRRAEDRVLSEWIDTSVDVSADGTVTARLREVHKVVWRPAAQLLIQVAAGHANPVTGQRMENLVFALNGKYFRPRTLGGTYIMRPQPETIITRDPGAEMTSVDNVWDGRFEREPDAPPIEPSSKKVARSLPPDFEDGGWVALGAKRLKHWQKIFEISESIYKK